MDETLFPADKRAIFPYQIYPPFSFALPTTGQQEMRFADPQRIDNRLIEFSAGAINDWLRDSGRGESQIDPPAAVRVAADEKLVKAVRYAFELPEFNPENGHGATTDYCLWLLDHFLEWRGEKKASIAVPQTSLPPSESGPGEVSATATSTDCC